jgi:hypothetical protein
LGKAEAGQNHQWVAEGLRTHGHNLVIYGLYGQHGVGAQGINACQFQQIAEHIRSLRGPWMIAGDFNFTPDEFRASGWLQWVHGTILLCDMLPTDRSPNGRIIDYVIVPTAFKHMFTVERVDSVPWGPHDGLRIQYTGGTPWDACHGAAPAPAAGSGLRARPAVGTSGHV